MANSKLHKLTALARTFPTFARGATHENMPGIEPFDPELLRKQIGCMSSGEQHAALFILWVYDPYADASRKFDLANALGVWDSAHRQAFAKWVTQPWWP